MAGIVKTYMALDAKVIEHSMENQKLEARNLINGEALTLFTKADASLEAIGDQLQKESEAASDMGDVVYARSRLALFGGVALMLVLGGGLAWWFAQRLIGALRVTAETLRSVASGDLT